jgi:hypothetical protein
MIRALAALMVTIPLPMGLMAQVPQPASDPAQWASVSGKITNAGGQPLAKADVTLRQNGFAPTPTFSATTGPDGLFELTGVPAGGYSLYAERTGYMPQGFGAPAGVQYPTGVRGVVRIAAGERLTGKDIQMSPATTFSGKVLDEDGDPVANAQVQVLRQLTVSGHTRLYYAQNGYAMSDQNGEYRMSNLQPARYFLMASPPASYDAVKRLPRKADEEERRYVKTFYPGTADYAAASMVDVFAGRDQGGMNISLKKAPVYHVRGRVAGADKNATLRVYRTGLEDSTLFNYLGAAAVQDDGTFDLPDVPAGQHAIIALNQGAGNRIVARRVIGVSTDDVQNLVLTVVPQTPIQGRIRLAGDAPPVDPNKPPPPPQYRVQVTFLDGIATMGVPPIKVDTDGTFAIPPLNPGRYAISISGAPAGSYWQSTMRGTTALSANILEVAEGSADPLDIVFGREGGTVNGVVSMDDAPTGRGACILLPDSDELLEARYSAGSAVLGGRCKLTGIRPGSWHLFALEENDVTGGMDSFGVRRMLEGRGAAVNVREKDTVEVKVSVITEAQLLKFSQAVR